MRFVAFLLLSFLGVAAHSQEIGKNYYIFHYSGMVMSAIDGRPNLHTFDATDGQVFQFVQSGNTYLIKSVSKNTNVCKVDEWDTGLGTSTGNTARFTVEKIGGDFVKFKCADNNRYLGTDAIAPGSYLYSDKSGNETLHYWFLREANAKDIVTDGLKGAINKAENRLNATPAGNAEGDYPTAARTALQKAIDDAQFALDNPASQTNVVNATKALTTALTTYNNSRNLPFSTGKTYYLMHASNRYLTNSGNEVLIKNATYNTAQQFTFEALNDGTYALKSKQGNNYLNASGEYSTTFAANTSNKTTHLKIGYAPNEDKYIRLQFASNSKYLGTDGTSDNKGVYSDKSGTDAKHYWMLIPADTHQGQPYTQFHNGSSALRLGVNWNDADGKHINVHGGCVLYENGTYYWFGENYRANPVKSNGIGCYTSKDLYNWKFEGMAYKCPEAPLRSDYQDMNYGRTLERPKVMYCPNTGKYVMWVHWENGSGYAASRVAILESDKIAGPYTFIKTMRPRGNEQPSGSRDQTLMFDPDYNVGYHFGSAEENMTMHGTLLTDNFLDLGPTWERMFVKKQYEAPAIFKYHKRFVAITSGCTGWDPNAGHSSYSQLPLTGWNDLGNPCVDDDKNTTYHSQSNYIFKVPGYYDAYIFMGDRWKGGDYFSDANVGESWHIWLPIDMRTGYPIMRFYADWDLSLFNKLNRYRRVAEAKDGNTYLLLSKNANKILSAKGGRLLLGEDNEGTNLSFKVEMAGNGYVTLTDVESGLALDSTDGNLSLAKPTQADAQKWQLTNSGTHDGYYYLVPANNKALALTNFSATPTAEGIVGLATLNKQTACQFAFCFDSQKYDYEPIKDESDGSYDQWMKGLGYEPIKDLTSAPTTHNTCNEVVLYATNGELYIQPQADGDINIWNINGQLLNSINAKANTTYKQTLGKGIYMVNGKKVVVE